MTGHLFFEMPDTGVGERQTAAWRDDLRAQARVVALRPCGDWHSRDALCVDCEDVIRERELQGHD